ncbi:interleukin-17 receptor A-like [Scleropages formosus]|uniref:interleukin-17 receptor A-like n=1 Tax=Scleropages formosus TaxID=113540 RepID=UPI0010FA6F71|nr:interleukin-17 receptor A-like [Scleropages formosus]
MRHAGTRLALLSALCGALSALRLVEGPPLSCSQEGLKCVANKNFCLDKNWLQPWNFTPTGPKKLRVNVTILKEKGNLVPVLNVTWRARTDGSIEYLNGTEVHILQVSNNYKLCVRYTFLNKINSMKKAHNAYWSFSLNRVVVDPEQMYLVSVYNLPRPNIAHDSYRVDKRISVPGCKDPMMEMTKICIESGSQWRSNISLKKSETPDKQSVITVNFRSGEFCTKYRVFVQCSGKKDFVTLPQSNESDMNATFALKGWSITCCNFSVEIQPFFIQCENDCFRHQKYFNICNGPSPLAPHSNTTVWLIVGLAVLLISGAISCVCLCSWKQKKDIPAEKAPLEDVSIPPKDQDKILPPTRPKKVLIIYSLDHALYREIVLKLSAFLRAKCGTEVVLDLLDTAWLGTVGRMQWLDWQKQQIEKSSDKILILCSRGVQAKWRAMCGGHKVMLKEDVRSPMGDMLTPAFSLIIPDLLHPVAFGKYIVAYFDDVSAEEDVPPPFNITIKYKLMKHFEELYFRILDMEKHEPGKVKRVEGIAEDEYFSCPSGRALRDAVEAFQAYQVEYPDWFERECVDSEEEALDSDLQCPLLRDINSNSILQCVPECREGPPILVNAVKAIEGDSGILSLTPLLNDVEGKVFTQQVQPSTDLEESQVYSVKPLAHMQWSQIYSVHPAAHLDECHVYSVNPAVEEIPEVWEADVHSSISAGPIANIAVQELSTHGGIQPAGRSDSRGLPEEGHEEESDSSSNLSEGALKSLLALQQALGPGAPFTRSSVKDQSLYYTDVASDIIQEGYDWKRPLSESDQGYISRASPQQDSSLKDDFQDQLDSLSRLQDACLHHSVKCSDYECYRSLEG